MSSFIRRYARYLNAKAMSYRTVAFDFTKVKRGLVHINIDDIIIVLTNTFVLFLLLDPRDNCVQ